jgi:hypothetical protein
MNDSLLVSRERNLNADNDRHMVQKYYCITFSNDSSRKRLSHWYKFRERLTVNVIAGLLLWKTIKEVNRDSNALQIKPS